MKSCSSLASTSSNESSGNDGTEQSEKEGAICSLYCLARCLSLPSEQIDLMLPDAGDFAELFTFSGEYQPFLRSSIFENVPPTIIFYPKGTKVKKPPSQFLSQLQWCNNSLLALVVRHSLMTSHFKLVDESRMWIGYWGRHLKSAQYRQLKPYQKVNHFPGAFHLGRKDRLWLHLHEMMERFPDEDFCVMPFTYVLPKDAKKLHAYFSVQTIRHVILKPPASARGTGISIVSRFNQVPTKTPLVAQHYIESPFLINGSKFDLRLYIYVTSYDPLRIYIYNQGLVRFASVPYSSSITSYSNQFIHLTNYSINKLAQQNGTTEEPVQKWPLTDFWTHLDQKSYNSAQLRHKINDVAIKAVVSCESHIWAHAAHYSKYPFVSHELYGMDILVDSNLQPWLIEMNISPSLHSSTPLDVDVKTPIAKDTLTMAGIPFPISFEDNFQSSLYFRTRNFQIHKSDEHLGKEQIHLEHFVKNGEIRSDICDNLTDADARILVEFEDEFYRKGGFQLIYPTKENSAKFLRFMRSPLYSNLLLDKWQKLAAVEKAEKMKQLKELCINGIHINTKQQFREDLELENNEEEEAKLKDEKD